MQSDPMGLAAGFNTYNYVDNNPMNGVAPLGLRTVDMGLLKGYYGVSKWLFQYESYNKRQAGYDFHVYIKNFITRSSSIYTWKSTSRISRSDNERNI